MKNAGDICQAAGKSIQILKFSKKKKVCVPHAAKSKYLKNKCLMEILVFLRLNNF